MNTNQEIEQYEDETISFDTPNWKPLEMFIPKEKLGEFMWMGTVSGKIETYKNCNTGHYVNIDSNGKFFKFDGYKYTEYA